MTLLLVHFTLLASLCQATARGLIKNTIDRILAAAMLFWGNIVATCLLLSCLEKLGQVPWFFRCSLLVAVALFFLVRRFVPQAPEPVAAVRPDQNQRNRWLIGLVFSTLLLIFLANIRIASNYPPNNYDSLTYHLPRVMYYLGQNSLAHFETEDIRQVYFSFNYNLLQLACFIYSPPIEVINFLNVAAWLVMGLGTYRVTRLSGCSFNASLSVMWLALTSTGVLAQATSTALDLPTAAALLGAVSFALRWRSTRRRSDAVLAGIAAGLAAGTKLTVVFFGPAFVLLLLIFGIQHWRSKVSKVFFANIREWLVPAGVASALGIPFILYNLAASGNWMTNKMDFTLNKPFSFACALQTAKGYLVQLFFEPLCRFSFDLDLIARLNNWFSLHVFANWNEAHAFSPLYVFPPDLNEDHVWYGFTGPLFLCCGVICLISDRKLRSPITWLALVGIGWFLTYFAMNKWSLYIQRYFLPAIILMGPCAGAVWDASKTSSRLTSILKRFVFWGVAATSAWFSVVYLAKNHNRPFSLPFSSFTAPQVLPEIPTLIQQRLAAQSRVNVITDGTNERIFLLMNWGRNQQFTSRQQVDPEKYNLLSYWGFTRNNIFSNIAHIASYTVVAMPGKATAGVEFLGTVGNDVYAYDYLGIAPRAESTPSTVDNSNIVVLVYYGPNDPNRFTKCRLRVEGLHLGDNARIEVTAEMTDGSQVAIMSRADSGKVNFSLNQPFKRLRIEIFDVETGRKVGFGELPYTTKPTLLDIPPPLSPTALFGTELISSGAARNLSVNGLADLEGPYSKWDLPLFRWAKQPTVRIEIPTNDQLKRINLSFALRLHVRDEARLDVVHNGKSVREFWLQGRQEWHTAMIDLTAAAGVNVIELRDRSNDAVPDWLAYLDKNPDVKDYLVSQGKPLEAGAREHYENNGRKENRVLPMTPNPKPPAPPPESLYFIYRSLRVEGFNVP